MLSINQVIEFCNLKNYDVRITGNARWIDQKCTPDVLWSISDFVLNYVDQVNNQFTPADIWKSDYAKLTIHETFSKPGTAEVAAESEYDKVFSQPLSLLCYAGVITDISNTHRHLYQVSNRGVLEYIATNDMNSLRFLQIYIEKVLNDSDLYYWFESFFNLQNKASFNILKSKFVEFYHVYTPIKKDYEPKRIFTKVLNPLAHKYGKCGTERGRMSRNKITKAEMMYNQDNFRDIYKEKPKDITRKEWLELNPNINIRTGYFEQMMTRAKATLRENIVRFRNNISELTQFDQTQNDMIAPSQIHHIFPKNEFTEIQHYIENLIAITPNQHFSYAHPQNNTQIIDLESQKTILLAKTLSIKENLSNPMEESIYEFSNLLYVLHVGWSDDNVLEIEENNYIGVVQSINYHYSEISNIR
jgi:hypothetical protein